MAYILSENGLADGVLNDTQTPWYFNQKHIHGELLRSAWEDNWKDRRK